MFLEFYKLREQPFGVTPDPRFLFMSETHRESLASLYYGLKTGRGFLALVARPGMGKTSLLFRLMQNLEPDARTVFLFQTQCDTREFLRYLLTDMGIACHGLDLVEMHSRLNDALVENARSGKQFVVIIDEAQNLDNSVLETVRLLSDFETTRSKLLQIILAGQPQLAEKLAHPSLVQLSQRVAILSRLKPFSTTETSEYIDHRLKVAGHETGRLFTPGAVEIIAKESHGIPRNINNLCFNALSWGYAEKQAMVDEALLRQVCEELAVNSVAAEAERFAAESRAEAGEGKRATSAAAPPVVAPVALVETARKLVEPVALEAEARKADMSKADVRGPTPVTGKAIAAETSIVPARTVGQTKESVRAAVSPVNFTVAASPPQHRMAYLAAAAVVLLGVFLAGYSLRGKDAKPIVTPVTAANPSSAPNGDAAGSASRASQATKPAIATAPKSSSMPITSRLSTSPLVESANAAAPKNASEKPDSAGVVTVIVKPQETLSQLSLQYLGQAEPRTFQQISDLNGLADPNRIQAGQRLVLPVPRRMGNGTAASGAITPEAAAAEQASGTTSQPENRRIQP
jgi:type II secretory pathway predicted ATPase ExeA